ncbi:MAG: GNAT family N-acetyltransferase [Ignavibacteria bacterium]|nr:GNAT family N-acetyltransferase [Ignavibacteria bacterium]
MTLPELYDCTPEERNIVLRGLNEYNLKQVPATLPGWWIKLEYVMKNDRQEVIAGILSELGYWCGLEVKILWVSEEWRNLGLGKRLLLETEKNAKAKGAVKSFLDTFDFQAKEFYLKNGYEVFGTLDNFPEGHKRYYMQKLL